MITVFGKVNFHIAVYQTPITKIYMHTIRCKVLEYLTSWQEKKNTSYKNNIVLKILPITVKQERKYPS